MSNGASQKKLSDVDNQISDLISEDLERQNSHIHLIASENFASQAVMEASGSVLTNKYSEGFPGRRYYEGCATIDEIEQLAIDRACELFEADHANVQPHSGSSANMAVYLQLLEAGDTVMGMNLDQGGHLTHGSPVNFSGRMYNFIGYGLDKDTELIDMLEVERLAHEHKPKLLIAGYSSYSQDLDFKAFREIADSIGATFMVDAAHFIGLVAGKVVENPMQYADVVTATTHKALRGPRGGLILSKEKFAKDVDKKDKGEEDAYGAGVAKGEKIEKKKMKKESIDSKLAEIGKEAEAVKLEAQLNYLHDHIAEKVDRVNSINEDENLQELIDKSKMKQMQKEIKLLEKRKAKMEKIYEKMCGKKYQKEEIVDEEMVNGVEVEEVALENE